MCEHLLNGKNCKQGLAALGRAPADDQLKQMVADAGGSDGLTHEQFQKFMGNMKEGTATEKEIMDALEVFDKDKNGTIDCKVRFSLLSSSGVSFFFPVLSLTHRHSYIKSNHYRS